MYMNSETTYWWPERKKLVFLSEKATPDFWDRQWQPENLEKDIARSRKKRHWRAFLQKYIPDLNSIILEGGCGDGRLVDALKFWGYNAIGVDFASKTVKTLKESMPDLDIRYGDVRKLEFPNNFFDGYISIGVIEHFWEGYDDILKEMRRVLKVGGYAFVVFPCISRLDRVKAFFSGYKEFADVGMPDNFYQFGLDISTVRKDFESAGFQLCGSWRLDGWHGMIRLWPAVQRVHEALRRLSKKSRGIELFKRGMGFLMAPLCGECVLLVFRLASSVNQDAKKVSGGSRSVLAKK